MLRSAPAHPRRRLVALLLAILVTITSAGCLDARDFVETDSHDHDDGSHDHHDEADGNVTEGNVTEGNVTEGNSTSGNQTDGNSTSGNQTDDNSTGGNNTTGPVAPEPITGKWAARAAIGKTTDHETETWTFGGPTEEVINITIHATLTFQETAKDHEKAVAALFLRLQVDGTNLGESGRIGGYATPSPAEPKEPEENPTTVEFWGNYTKAGAYSMALHGRGLDTPYLVEWEIYKWPVA